MKDKMKTVIVPNDNTVYRIKGKSYHQKNGKLDIPEEYVRYLGQHIKDLNETINAWDNKTVPELQDMIMEKDSFYTKTKLKTMNKNSLINILIEIEGADEIDGINNMEGLHELNGHEVSKEKSEEVGEEVEIKKTDIFGKFKGE